MIHTGEATNVVPDFCEIQGTVRTFTHEVLDLIERACAVAEHTCAAFGASASSSSPQLPAHRQPRRRDRVRAPARAGRGGRRRQRAALRAHDGLRGLQLLPAGQARLLLRHRQRRRQPPRRRPRPGAVHAAQPQLRLQRRADPAGRHRLGAHGRAWLAGPAPKWPKRRRHFFAQTYAEARGKFLAAAEAAGLDVHATATRCWAATARRWRWTWHAAAPPTRSAAGRQQRLPRRGGFLRLGRAGALLADAELPRRARRPPAWRCCTCMR
jgi:hypothetical protein